MSRSSLTLRQIEVLRAIMVSGTLAGAAKLLNVSAPGLSRLVKYTEQSLGFQLFDRRQGRLIPTKLSQAIFEQINGVYGKVEDLRYVIDNLDRGASQELKFGAVPSISYVMAPRAVEKLRRAHPDLKLDIDILKTEEAINYLLLGKGELVAMSYRVEHPALNFELLASGHLYCIAPEHHELAARDEVSARDIARFPLIGIDPRDPYGRIMADLFAEHGCSYDIAIRARFGATVCALVRAGLGVAVIDQFTLGDEPMPGIKILRITESTHFHTWVATKVGAPLSSFALHFVSYLRREMQTLVKAEARRIGRG